MFKKKVAEVYALYIFHSQLFFFSPIILSLEPQKTRRMKMNEDSVSEETDRGIYIFFSVLVLQRFICSNLWMGILFRVFSIKERASFIYF